MNKELKSILLAMIIPLLFLAVATSPVGFLGCRNRGLIALSIAVISIVFAFIVSVNNLRNRMKGKPFNPNNLIRTLILAFPAVYILILYYFN